VTAKADEPLSTVRQLELMRQLQRLANERWEEESQTKAALADGLCKAQEARQAAADEIDRRCADARARATAKYEQVCSIAQSGYERERDAAQQEYKGLRRDVESEHTRTMREALSEQQTASWETLAVFDAIKGRPQERFYEAMRRIQRSNQELAILERDAETIMKMRRQWRDFPSPLPSEHADQPIGNKAQRVVLGRHEQQRGWADLPSQTVDPTDRAIERVEQLAAAVRVAAEALNQQKLPRLFEGGYPLGVFVAAWLLAIVPCVLVLGGWWSLAASAVLAVVATGGLLAWLFPIARQQSGNQFHTIQQLLVDARQAATAAVEQAKQRGRGEAQTLAEQRDEEIAASEQKLHTIIDEKGRWRETEIGRAGQTFPSLLADLRSRLNESLTAAEREYNETLSTLTAEHDRQVAENQRNYDDRCRQLHAEHDGRWDALARRWSDGLASLRDAWDSQRGQCGALFPDWQKIDYDTWQRPAGQPAAIQFGRVTLDLAHVKHGIPDDQRLRPAETTFELPALMTLGETPVLLITADDEGRRQAIDTLQLIMLRMLTAMPPGKVRLTILDPVGLGENFASFMHLADIDEKLIASRIWTDSRQIEDQLARLTAHMETVLQKYLRNEFATIDQYNAQAGEVAEPYQVLVVANFPANFTEAAARKLVSIATSGPRCGVYTLLSVDRKQRLPNEFHLDDLKPDAVHLDWDAHARRFRWRYPAFEQLPLTLDRPPSADRFNDVVRAAGHEAKDSLRVEVPFEMVAPKPERIWSDDCSRELAVPIGRAGAMRLQSVRLGLGTAQHLLVCGKTGSGKSTFLHALITNTALHYSPGEVEFYLIDFKKGVEFKTYATHRLPHARVIAIESEREFGLSVLERLDSELRRRGDLFRTAGVQDLPDFRAARPDVPMPRVLLVIDEFQELFVEDDKLSQDASLLLDRLVRQGRAFGIHVLLGSQTLSGAYTLARSTMGQMAVRIALQCSEADSHVIFNDERNMAARFLGRPGEAIYNDQNGLVAGNHPFQVVWLSEAKRIGYLKQVEERAVAAGGSPASSTTGGSPVAATIVFEGNVPSDPANNRQLCEALSSAPPSDPAAAAQAWLGAAVAIKEPTSITFGRHAGSNLLVVGSWEESARGVLANAVIALAAQSPAGKRCQEPFSPSSVIDDRDAGEKKVPDTFSGVRFVILDGTRPDAHEAGAWQRVADALPHDVTVVGVRETAATIAAVAEELARREAAGQEDAPPLYLVVYNGGRFRDLRRNEDDFGFSVDRDKPPRPDKQWAEILRNGPAWGVHSLVWCDSYNNVTRLMDRLTMREFELRVAFQMSAADSTSLLETPAASRLRAHRGLLASEDVGTLEKFRPYTPPSDEWLEHVRTQLAARRVPV
jgi:S-DNA-T family DNA segregation ATPase FtsK/SpoIIIE